MVQRPPTYHTAHLALSLKLVIHHQTRKRLASLNDFPPEKYDSPLVRVSIRMLVQYLLILHPEERPLCRPP